MLKKHYSFIHNNMLQNQKKANLLKGKFGENLAVEFLRKRGYEILDRNFYSRFGELDLVTRQKDEIVFVEVKLRKGTKFGIPEEGFTGKKQERIIKTIWEYLAKHSFLNSSWRCDLLVIEIDGKNKIIRQEIWENILEEKQ